VYLPQRSKWQPLLVILVGRGVDLCVMPVAPHLNVEDASQMTMGTLHKP
jgi:hypothetical protein